MEFIIAALIAASFGGFLAFIALCDRIRDSR